MRNLTAAASLFGLISISAISAHASVEISSAATKNMSCSAGVCSPTDKKAVLNVTDLTNMLASGDVKITTGNGAITITVSSPFSWTSTQRLTLDAYQSVSFRAPVAVAGTGAVTIVTNDGGTGGDLIFFPGAKLDFWDTSSSLVINGRSYLLVNDLASLASAIGKDQLTNVAFAGDYDASNDGIYANGAVTTNFDGTFEGLGHTISNFTAAGVGRAYVGLFSNISTVFHEAVLRDIHMLNADIRTGNSGAAGALVGSAPLAQIVGVTATGNIVGAGNAEVGGVAGANAYGSIDRSWSAANLGAGTFSTAGGLVGGGASVAHSYATGTITTGKGSEAGGLIGFEDGDFMRGFGLVSQSWAKVNLMSSPANRKQQYGGLIGAIGQYVEVHDTYAEGSVSAGGSSLMGGLAGWAEVYAIQTSYSVGHVQYGSTVPGSPRVGGFIGDFQGNSEGETGDYWDIDTSGYSTPCGNKCPGVQGLTDVQLKGGLPAGFDPAIWGQSASINNGYPYLLANPPPQ